ncbi:acetyl-CoA carboxylase biotin carboxylase subunit [bacterium]|nr:acetyl-CoA carboxylase biotin carboxylase subunit [bacterium]
MIKKVLIANRGEIAVRIARTCREMGIATAAVYSDVDRNALHVQVCDEEIAIGGETAAESYLVQEKILKAAKETGADAIHPGYGFLSENPTFAEKVKASGFIWIGPPAQAIRVMGSKTEARRLMKAAKVPVVPGSEGVLRNSKKAVAFAKEAGLPILLKASAGGGGKGMRVVREMDQVAPAYDAAKREATAAFGDGSIYAEKFIEEPRHIEVQIMADLHGNVIHLGERECSLQRRHQKLVEESPSPSVSPETRQRLGETAVMAAKACGYENAGTIEYLMDKNGEFYFLEMNTRLQVEHPVTEEVTGMDLVRMQLRVASGEPLSISQNEIQQRGHAIEVRIYAEDVRGGFLPSTGKLDRLRPPIGPGIREDAGLTEGMEVSRFYDPMISKLIVHAENRDAAIQRMIRALAEYQVSGLRTTIPICHYIVSSKEFATGEFHTGIVEALYAERSQQLLAKPLLDEEMIAAAIARALHGAMPQAVNGTNGHQTLKTSIWKRDGRERSHRHLPRRS